MTSRLTSIKRDRRSQVTLFALAFAVIGVITIILTRAATADYSIEPETSTLAGNASVVSNTNASGGQAIRFNAPSSGGGSSENCEAGIQTAGGFTLPNLCGWPTASTTGPRQAHTTTSGSMITTHDGQVIERVLINGSLDIRHNNVTVRDVTIMGTGLYSLDIGQNTTPCPSNLRIEYVEVNMAAAGNNELPIYQRCAGTVGHVFDHIKVHNCGRGIQLIGNATVTNSYIYCHRTDPDSHRTAISSHGGSNFTVTHNTFLCVGQNCSSSVNMYSDYAPITNYLLQDNLVGGGSICVRGGETHTFAAETRDIRVLNNHFSTHYFPECGSLQAFAQFDEDNPGNVRSGNVYHESGQPIPGE